MASSGRDRIVLRLLATSDLHANLVGYDYHADRPRHRGSLDRLGTLIRQARAQQPNTLLFDNGDLLHGSPIGESGSSALSEPHPMIVALNSLAYDAATLGNHDFDYGLPSALAAVEFAAFPVVMTNLRLLDGTEARFARNAILRRKLVSTSGEAHDVNIGVIGLLPTQTAAWNQIHLGGQVEIDDVVAAAMQESEALVEAGADIVVALAHTGIVSSDGSPDPENLSLPLAQLPHVDALVLGHTHEVFPGPIEHSIAAIDAGSGLIAGKPAVMPGFNGSHLGVIDLVLERKGKGWSVGSSRCECRPVAELDGGGGLVSLADVDGMISDLAATAHRRARERLARPVGTTDRPLHTYFALSRPTAALALMADAQRHFVKQALAGFPGPDVPILSAVAPLKAGGRAGPESYTDIPPGPLAIRHVEDLCPFPNTVCATLSSGAQVRRWLERSAEIFRRIERGVPEQPLHVDHARGFAFDVIDGLTYRIDLSAAEGEARILDLRFEGVPVRDDDRFIVATNSHRVAEEDLGETVLMSRDLTRDVLAQYITTSGNVAPVPRPTWGFVPMQGATVTFLTGPGARRFLGQDEAGNIRLAGMSPDGFLRLEFCL